MTDPKAWKGHTPGPWKSVGWSPPGIFGPGDLADSRGIAHLDRRLPPSEATANGLLIAAAPDLAAEVERLRKALRQIAEESMFSDTEAIVRHALAALKEDNT